ncbi:hypothetical protein FPV67DRAFT_1657708 [Lyophyllum atratum]|nr:hypothetical protein FPV67DRAFT_1657708 [Lyophyllum atratum]
MQHITPVSQMADSMGTRQRGVARWAQAETGKGGPWGGDRAVGSDGNEEVVADGDDEPKPSDDGWQWKGVQEGPDETFLASVQKQGAEVGLRIARKSGSGNGAVVADGDDEPKPSDDGWQWENVQEGPGKAFLVSGRKWRAEVAGGGRGRRGRGLESSPPSSSTSQSRQKADGSGGGYRRALPAGVTGGGRGSRARGMGWSPSSSMARRSRQKTDCNGGGYRRALARPSWRRFVNGPQEWLVEGEEAERRVQEGFGEAFLASILKRWVGVGRGSQGHRGREMGWSLPSSTTSRSCWRASHSKNGCRRDLARPSWRRFENGGQGWAMDRENVEVGEWGGRRRRRRRAEAAGVRIAVETSEGGPWRGLSGVVEPGAGSETTSGSTIEGWVVGKNIPPNGNVLAHRMLGPSAAGGREKPACSRVMQERSSLRWGSKRKSKPIHTRVDGREVEMGGRTTPIVEKHGLDARKGRTWPENLQGTTWVAPQLYTCMLKSTPKPVPEARRPHPPSAIYGLNRSREIGGPRRRSVLPDATGHDSVLFSVGGSSRDAP